MTYTDYTGCDHDLFLALNFDGGPATDRLMLAVSGTWMWVPLYLLICYLVLRGDRPLLPGGDRFAGRADWRRLLLFAALLGATIGLSDMVAGIFKANGLLGDLLPDFSPRCRPMYTPSLEGLDIACRRMDRPRAARGAGRPLRHRLGPRRHRSRAGRPRGRRDPPAVVHGAGRRLRARDLLLAHLPGQALPARSAVGGPRRRGAGRRGAGMLPPFHAHETVTARSAARFRRPEARYFGGNC